MRLTHVLFTIAASSAMISATTVCTASQCLDSSSEISLSFTGSLKVPSSSNILLIPDQYTSSSPSNVVSDLSSGQAAISLPSYLTSTASSTGSISGVPFTLSLQPGVSIFPLSYYRNQPVFASLNLTGNTTSRQSLTTGSVLVSEDAFAIFSGSQSEPVVFWGATPDVSQLPSGLLSGNSGAANLIDVQSTTCSTPCAASSQCNAAGVCVCKPGFTGQSCEACATGFFGPQCQPCTAGCTLCDQGINGSGRCIIPSNPNDPALCNCENGQCGSNGQCACSPGWSTSTSNATANSTQCATCAPGTFKDSNGNCQACSLNCSACSDGTGTCTQCRAGFVSSPTDPTLCSATSTGAGSCQNGLFPLPGGGCGNCTSSCTTCTGPTASDCLTCPPGNAQVAGTCVPVSANGICGNSGLVISPTTEKCQPCPNKCASCSIANFNLTTLSGTAQCTACLPGSFLSNGQCVSQCPASQFVASDGLTCQNCDPACGTCAGVSNYCLSCAQAGLFAANGTCVSTCPPGSFPLSANSTTPSPTSSNATTSIPSVPPSGGACSSCHPDCASCSGPGFDQCTSCPTGNPVKSSGRCLKTCGQAQFFDNTSQSCQSCAGNCASCASGANNQCTSCSAGFILQSGQCVPATCPGGASPINQLGSICLATLLGVSNSTLATNTSDSKSQTILVRAWPFFLSGGLGLILLVLVALLLWRRYARKKREAGTKRFKERLERDGIMTHKRGFWARLWGRDPAADAASARRFKLRAQLRDERQSAEQLDIEEVDLERTDEILGEKRFQEWRAKLPRSNPSRSRGMRSRESEASSWAYSGSGDSDSDSGPEQPMRRTSLKFTKSHRGPKTSRSEHSSRRTHSDTRTTSAYSDTTNLGGPTKQPSPKQPMKPSQFDGAQMYAPATGPSIRYPPEEYTTGTWHAVQVQPTIAAVQAPQPGQFAIPVVATTAGSAANWQTMMLTGSSNGKSATGSKTGDKNPFRQ